MRPNRQNTAHETSLLESFNFISRNPLIGYDFAAIKNSVVKCAPIVEASNCENNPRERPLSSSLTLFQGTLSSEMTLLLLKIQ